MKKRRFKGTGYIFPRNGIYYFKITVNGRQKLQTLNTRNKKEAELKVKELLPILAAKTKEEIALHIGMAKNLIKEKTVNYHQASLVASGLIRTSSAENRLPREAGVVP